MNKELELIAKQQLEIEEYKQQLRHNAKVLLDIAGDFIAIGSPLNENLIEFNEEQLEWCSSVYDKIRKLHPEAGVKLQ
jgi:hypothetical protein